MTQERDPRPHEPAEQQQDGTPAEARQEERSDSWDPWAPPTPQTPPHAEHTQPVGVEHTQPVDFPNTQSLPAQPPAAAPEPQPAWTHDPQPAAPGQPSPGHGDPAQHGQPWGATGGDHAAYQQEQSWPAGQGWSQAQAGHHSGQGPQGQGPQGQWAQGQWAQGGHPRDWTQAHHATTQGAPTRRGPGWGALVAVAAVSALLAGLFGGLAGGWLGANDRLDFARGRGPSSIPTVGSGATSRPEGSIANIAAKALPSVVTIKVSGADGNGTGSGFVADREGHIITNNHVVAGAGSNAAIKVQLANGAEIRATVAGRDASYDLAVLKTGRSDLPPLTMGSSSSVVVGDQVIAVGAPLGLDSTVTTGIVSALNRPVSPGGDGDEQSYINAIQTDAAINPGNSGGPLLDMGGNVVGVNSAIARVPGAGDAQSGNIGVGFSIPSDQVRKTAEQLIRTGKAEHPIIGVILDRQYTGADGVKILEESAQGREPITPDGPAAKAGLRPGDLIVEFNGKKVTDPDDLVVAIRAKSVGDEVTMKVRRDGREINVRMTLQGTTSE